MTENHQNHPIEDLFNALQTIIPCDLYPAGVEPVSEMVPGTAFFPGGPGLWLGESCSEAPPNWPPMPKCKVMVLGNHFCLSLSEHQKWLEKCPYGDLDTDTWKNLRPLFSDAGIRLEDCFFTNAYMGLRPESGGPPPGADDFKQRCESFLDKQIEVQKPRLILALGEHAITLIARLSTKLDAWRKWQSFKKLDDNNLSLISKVCFKDAPEQPVTVVALMHPSMRKLNLKLYLRHYCGQKGNDAEIAMIKDALHLSGLEGNDE